MKTINKSDLHFIGLYRGIEQYEVLSDMSLLVLKLDEDRYYLSKCEKNEDYNVNIIERISAFYIKGVSALGELIEVKE